MNTLDLATGPTCGQAGERLADGRPPAAGGNYRWVICALLFAATTINYMDRQVIGILKPQLQTSLHWTETDFASIIFWFQFAYAAGYLLCGRLVDRIGARLGLSLFVTTWSLAELGHTLVRTVAGFAARTFLPGPGRRRKFSRLRSRPSASGFPSRRRAWRRASSTPAATSARCLPLAGAVAHGEVRLAGSLRGNPCAGLRLAYILAPVVRFAGAAPPSVGRRTGLYPSRSAGTGSAGSLA